MNFDPAIIKKAFEIAYALIRTADTISPDPFARYFKDLALKLLSATTLGTGKRALAALRSIEYITRLAGSTGAITSRNGEVIAEEANGLYSHIMAATNIQPSDDVDLSGIFSAPMMDESVSIEESGVPAVEVPQTFDGTETEIEDMGEKAQEAVPSRAKQMSTDLSIRAQIRQSAILEKIRQSGNCRMIELRQSFPDVSERTLRYDLETLSERGLVERVGHSGPSTSYRAREISTA